MTRQAVTEHTVTYKGVQTKCVASAGVNLVSISMHVTLFGQELMANDSTAATEHFHLIL
jgi:hypothetical protein